MSEVKHLNLSIQLNGLKELSEKLDAMNFHIKKATSIAEEIAEIEFTATTTTAEDDEREIKQLTPEVEKELLDIAKRESITVLRRGDLEKRNNDRQDFLDIPVWRLKQMLEEAYKLGRKHQKEGRGDEE